MEDIQAYKTKIEKGINKLWIPHNNKEMAFIFPAIGLYSYENAGKQILEKGLEIPTGDETASLLYAVYCSDALNEPEFAKIKDIKGLWVFNKNLWTENGVYVYQDFDGKGTSISSSVWDLENLLQNGEEISGVIFSKDKRVRFATKESYKIRKDLSKEEIINDGFIIASFGKEGAEKIGEISHKTKNSFYIEGIDIKKGYNPKHPEKTSAFLREEDGKIRIDGFRSSDVGLNYSLGILPRN